MNDDLLMDVDIADSMWSIAFGWNSHTKLKNNGNSNRATITHQNTKISIVHPLFGELAENKKTFELSF